MRPPQIVEKCNRAGLILASDAQIAAFRDAAARLIDPGVASVEVFQRVQRHTQASVFVHVENEAVTGALALFFFRPEGLAELLAGRFNPADPALPQICAPGEAAAAAYGWGFAAVSKAGGRAAVEASIALRDDLFSAIPSFTRPATPDGERVLLGSIGYRPYPGIPGLAWIPGGAPPTRRGKAAEAA